MSTLTLQEVVERTSDIPTMPEAALAVVRMSNDLNANASVIADKISYDQSLTARVLRLSNSAYYGLPRQITSLQDAVVMLGMKTVRHLALVASTYPWLVQPRKGYGLGPQAMWEHSIAVSIGTQMIAERNRKINSEEAFTAGLLHDLGKVVLSLWMEDKVARLVERSETEQVPFNQLEREEFGFDHCDAGAYLAERWNLPAGMTNAIRYHHTPDACDPQDLLVDAVHMADVLAMGMGYGLGGDGLNYPLSSSALDRLGLTAAQCEEISAELAPAFRNAMSIYGSG